LMLSIFVGLSFIVLLWTVYASWAFAHKFAPVVAVKNQEEVEEKEIAAEAVVVSAPTSTPKGAKYKEEMAKKKFVEVAVEETAAETEEDMDAETVDVPPTRSNAPTKKKGTAYRFKK